MLQAPLLLERAYIGLEQLSKAQLMRDPCAIKCLTAAELMAQTDSMVLWLKGGDHSWKNDISLIEARYYAADLTRFIRASGDTECTHAMGTADLLVNLGNNDLFGKPFAAFVAYNHDRVENNRGIVTPQEIVLTCWQGEPHLMPFLVWALDGITDYPNLNGRMRLQAQVAVANNDKTGFLGQLRILEKLEALNRELFNAHLGIVPFRGDWGRTRTYLNLRMDMIGGIHSRYSAPYKRIYMKTAYELTKQLSKIERAKYSSSASVRFRSSAPFQRAMDGFAIIAPRHASQLNLALTP